MRKSGAVAALIVGLLVVTALAGVQAVNAQSSTSPPKNLKLVGDHWTPWDPPPAGPDAYIIVKGDTLWDLSGRWLGDPFLWPQIWDENRYILDSHWIYPGDPLVIPGRPTVVPEGELPADEGDITEAPVEPEEPEEVAEVPPAPVPPPLVPVADAMDVYCSGYIDPEHVYSELWVAGREQEKEHLAQGDVIYLNQGRNQGIQAGDEFGIIRPTHGVVHPTSGSALGTFVRRLGRVRVMITQENTSTAVIASSCEDILQNDELVVWEEIPIPMRRSMPPFERYDVTPSGGDTGHIVEVGDRLDYVAEGHIIYVDLGVASGINPGEVLTLYEERGELPRVNLGQAVVITVEPLTSTAKLTMTVKETEIGDRVEILR
jgi:hypothetical protein